MACRALLLVLLVALAYAPLAALAHTPTVTKSTLKSGKTVLTITAKAATDQVWGDEAAGDRLVTAYSLDVGGHGHFPRYAVCTAVCASASVEDCPLGLAYQCSTETHFPAGSVVAQGTLFLANGVLAGSTAIVGGTGAFKAVRGTELTTYDTSAGTGTTKFFLS